MEHIRKLIVDSVEATYENVVKNDEEYRKLESEKNEIINANQNNKSVIIREKIRVYQCLIKFE